MQGNFSSAATTAFAGLSLKELEVNSNPELGGFLDPARDGPVCSMVQQTSGLSLFMMGGTAITGSLPSCLFNATSSLTQLYAR